MAFVVGCVVGYSNGELIGRFEENHVRGGGGDFYHII